MLSVVGRTIHDADVNGIHDPDEAGLDGWSIELVDSSSGQVTATSLTAPVDLDENGTIDPATETGVYTFEDVPPGEYEVREVTPPGWAQTFPTFDADRGRLELVQVVDEVLGGADGLTWVVAATVSRDGNHLYAVSTQDDAVVAFDRDADTGRLRVVQVLRDGQAGVEGLDGARSVAISPDGRHVYVGGKDGDAVAAFARDVATGALAFVGSVREDVNGVTGLNGVQAVAISPDGNTVYTAAQFSDALNVFHRNAVSGALTLLQSIRDGQDGADGLNGASSLAVDPDTGDVYVAAVYDHSVAVYRPNPVTGALSFVQVTSDGQDGIEELRGACSVVVGPGGGQVYVAARDDDAITVFRRDVASGELAFEQVVDDGQAGDGQSGNGADDAAPLDRVSSVVASPDGKHLYAAAAHDSALTSFARDPMTGRLTFVEAARNGEDGVHGLNYASSVTISPDGKHVYTTAQHDHSVAVFDRTGVAPRTHRLSIAAGEIIENVNFGNYTLPAPRVVSSSIGNGDVVATGDVTFRATFDEQLRGGPLRPTAVELLGELSGPHEPVFFDYDPGNSTLTVRFADLPEDAFQLTLNSGDGQFEGLTGTDLDGDGTPGGDFVLHFGTDLDVLDAVPFPLPLRPTMPLGSLIYDGYVRAVVAPGGDADRFTIALDAGQTVTVVARGDAAIQPAVMLLDPAGVSLGAATAAAPGEGVVLQAIRAAFSGTYTVALGDSGGGVGGCNARLILNAAAEHESHGGPANDTIATAEYLDGSFTVLGHGPAERSAVLGTAGSDDDWYGFSIDGDQSVQVVLANVGTFGSLTLEWYDGAGKLLDVGEAVDDTTWQIGPFADASADDGPRTCYVRVAGDASVRADYSLLVVRDGVFSLPLAYDNVPNVVDVPLDTTAFGSLGIGLEPEMVFAAVGDMGTGMEAATQVAEMLHGWEPEFVITTGDTNTINPVPGDPSWTATLGNLYGDFIKARSDGAYPELTSPVQRYFPAVGNHDGNFGDFTGFLDYLHDNPAGDPAGGRLPDGVHTSEKNYYDFRAGPIHFFVVDSDCASTNVACEPEQMAWLESRLAASTADWKFVYFHHAPYVSGGYGGTGRMQWPFGEWGAGVVISGHNHLYERIHRGETIYFVNGTGGQGLYEFSEPVDGSAARYNDDHGAMRISVDDLQATFDFFSIDDGAGGQDGGRLIDTYTVDNRLPDSDGAVDFTEFRVDVTAGESLLIEAFTPAGGAGEFANLLELSVALIDPAGEVVADDANGTSGGRNARLTHTAVVSGAYTVRVAAENDSSGEYTVRIGREAGVVGRHVFYNNSAFDGDDPAPGVADDAAIAVDKTALLPGGVAGFNNYTNYASGINGLMIDVAGAAVTPTAADFLFHVGSDADPADWPTAAAPATIDVRPGAGVGWSDRVTLTWPDETIANAWLKVTVLGDRLGMAADDVFYFGNAVAEAGNSPTDTHVTATDLLLARNNRRSEVDPAAVDFAYDYNRDGRVDVIDVLLARDGFTNFLSMLRLLDLSQADLSPDGR